MNAVCPYCGEAQHYSVMWMDTVVLCRYCAREFLLSNKPRDQVPSCPWSPRAIREFNEALVRALFIGLRFIWQVIIFPF